MIVMRKEFINSLQLILDLETKAEEVLSLYHIFALKDPFLVFASGNMSRLEFLLWGGQNWEQLWANDVSCNIPQESVFFFLMKYCFDLLVSFISDSYKLEEEFLQSRGLVFNVVPLQHLTYFVSTVDAYKYLFFSYFVLRPTDAEEEGHPVGKS